MSAGQAVETPFKVCVEVPENGSSREALIFAGGRLIGLNGLEGASLRRINEAAGQKRPSAAHYYFGPGARFPRGVPGIAPVAHVRSWRTAEIPGARPRDGRSECQRWVEG